MKKWIIIIAVTICVVVPSAVLVFNLVKHKHNFSTEWSVNETHHWRACDDCDEIGSYGEHRWDSGTQVTAPTCTQDRTIKFTCLTCGKNSATTSDVGTALGHSYGAWVIDGDEHYRVCTRDGCGVEERAAHSYNQNIATNDHLKAAADCENAATYYVSCVCGKNGTEIFTDGTALGHNYGPVQYEWEEDGSECRAVQTCSHDENHKIIVNATVTSVVSPRTCEDAEIETFTATFDDATLATQTKTIQLNPALGHSYGVASYDWADDYSTCTASRVCSRDASHIEEETVSSVPDVTQHQDCDCDEQTTFTATFSTSGFYPQTEHNIITKPMLGHDWTQISYDWAEDYSYCEARRDCLRNPDHNEFEIASSTPHINTERSCYDDEITTFIAYFTNPDFGTEEIPYIKTADRYGHSFTVESADMQYWCSDADCETATLYYKSCEYCGEASDSLTFEVGYPLDHDFENGDFASDDDYHWKTCAYCGIDDIDNKVAHEFTQEVVDDEFISEDANCQHGTLYFKSCECGTAGTETFEYGELGDHIFTYRDTVSTYFKTSATCEHGTLFYYRCENCGAHGENTFENGEPLGHSYGAWIIDGDEHYRECVREGCTSEERAEHIYDQNVATEEYLISEVDCENAATYYMSCVCGKAGTETFTVGEPLGHQYDEGWVVDETHHWHIATCEHTDVKVGYEEHNLNGEGFCSICGSDQDERYFQIFLEAINSIPVDESWTVNIDYVDDTYLAKDGELIEDEGNVRYNATEIVSYNSETGDMFYSSDAVENGVDLGLWWGIYIKFDNGNIIFCNKDIFEVDNLCYLINSEDVQLYYENDLLSIINYDNLFGLNYAASLIKYREENPLSNITICKNEDDTFTLTINGSMIDETGEFLLETTVVYNANGVLSYEGYKESIYYGEEADSVFIIEQNYNFNYGTFDSDGFNTVIEAYPPTLE